MFLLQVLENVFSMFAIITLIVGVLRYLYYVLKMSMPDFLTRYQTGLNIKPEIFDSFKVKVHRSLEVQKIIVKILDSFNVDLEEKEIEKYKKIKEYHLDNMFPG